LAGALARVREIQAETREDAMSEEDPQTIGETSKEQWLPLNCPCCGKSAYDIDIAWLLAARSIMPKMIRASDPKAPELEMGMAAVCPYCKESLGVPRLYAVVGGGWEVGFRWNVEGGETR
jgi:hypothetical protein